MATLNERVNEALVAWAKVARLDPERNTFNGWHARQEIEALNQSREWDPSGLTTFMMLRGLLDQYLTEEVHFSAKDLIENPEKVIERMRPIKALREALEQPEVVEIIEQFQKRILDAAEHYGVKAEGVKALRKLLNDKYSVGFIRRDALRSIETLETHQFTQGKGDPAPLQVNRKVFEFWNINSILRAMQAQDFPGISMCLIRDPDIFESYFVFAVRNGDTLTILTDRQEHAHPAQSRMSRRPDRTLEQRAERHWFPYELLDMKVSADGKHLYAAQRTALVRTNVVGVPLKDVSELGPHEFIWAILVFDLIRERFWVQQKLLPEVSYTGEMIIEPQALVGAGSALVKSGQYQYLELPHLTAKDVTEQTTAGQWEYKTTRHNAWMEERYASKVPDDFLNVVGEQQKLLLEQRATKLLLPAHRDEKTEALTEWGEDIDPDERSKHTLARLEMAAPTWFGTKDKLERDRVWAARANQMKAVQALAEEEFQREAPKVLAWAKERVQENREFLFDACARGELKLPSRDHAGDSFKPQMKTRLKNAMRQKQDSWQYMGATRYGLMLGEFISRRRGAHFRCAEEPDFRASIMTEIDPDCPEALAILLGVEVKDMPVWLQHWFVNEPYQGNCILDRLDPQDWVLDNPWTHESHNTIVVTGHKRIGLDFSVYVCHSKDALNRRRKKLGLPKVDWDERLPKPKKGDFGRW